MGAWMLIVNVLFPIPLILLILLSIPLPARYRHPIRQWLLKVIDNVIFFKIFGEITLYQILTIVSSVLFLLSMHDAGNAMKRETQASNSIHAEKLRCSRFRYERNFWISLFSVSLWIILFRVRSLIKEVEEQINRNGSNSSRSHSD